MRVENQTKTQVWEDSTCSRIPSREYCYFWPGGHRLNMYLKAPLWQIRTVPVKQKLHTCVLYSLKSFRVTCGYESIKPQNEEMSLFEGEEGRRGVPICDQKSYDFSSEYGSEIPIKKYFGGIIRSRSWSRSRKNIFGSAQHWYMIGLK